jgi:serine/threonine-protein kinase OSR1/STK39
LSEPHGAARSPQVWRAKCKPLDEVVAIKILDLERQDPGKLVREGRRRRASAWEAHPPRCAQEEIRKEAQTMSLLNHPNLVSCYCSFVNGPVSDPQPRRAPAAPSRPALGAPRTCGC